ncbi:DUF2752 domain-containing protein [Streptomyces sp. NPDC015501]|uniref:DUF2752 domain-containing protein n=2 Tax=unclassified Streptomyces TaxID=2593676 RepID=UPI001276AC69|nr:hypothetical protein A3L22_05205 [Streptomyces griseus subsp. griseus]
MDASPTPSAAQPAPGAAPPPGTGPGPARPETAPQGPGPGTMPPTVCPTPEAAPYAAPDRQAPHPGPCAAGFAQGRPVPPPVHPSRLRRLAVPAGILAAVAGAFAYVGAVDPNEAGHYPVCPLLRLTGILCPGCGGLRSAHAFVTGDLGAAFSANAIATAGYFLFAALWALWLVRAWRGRPLRIGLAPVHWWAVGAVLAVFTVVRNLPFGSALAP